MRAATTVSVVLLGALCAGCAANVTHQRETTQATGIRYYENAPYLLIYSDGKGGLKWQIRYLPDQSKVMTATPSIVGGRTEMTLNFQAGVLSTALATGDTTELPKAVIAAVQSALPLLVVGKETIRGPRKPTPPGFPAPYLYKIVAEGNTLTFLGGRGDTKIQVPINEGAAK
jgi:hypothetical protein